MRALWSFALALLLAAPLLATPLLTRAEDPIVFDNPADEERFLTLTAELRCLVCQNQTLSDSDAPLAQDLRQEIHDMIQAGRSNQEIKAFMVDRYGDFVLYRPPVQSNTLVLWAAPLILLLIGGAIIARSVRRRAALLDAESHDEIGHDPHEDQGLGQDQGQGQNQDGERTG